MENILTNLATTIRREVRDIGHMRLCDGFEYAIVTYRKTEQLVRRAYPDGNWQFVVDLEATIKADIAAEQEMQQLDTAVDPDGLDKEGQEAWNELLRPEAIEPLQVWVWPCGLCGNLQDPNVNWEGIPANCSRCMRYICNEHGGVDVEGNIWCEICAKEHNVVLVPDPIPVIVLCEGCHRTEEMCICCGVPDETPGWPPSAQETVYYQEVMAKPDEF